MYDHGMGGVDDQDHQLSSYKNIHCRFTCPKIPVLFTGSFQAALFLFC